LDALLTEDEPASEHLEEGDGLIIRKFTDDEGDEDEDVDEWCR
jgi:hypothetical protein